MRSRFVLIALIAALAMAGSARADDLPPLELNPEEAGEGDTVTYSGSGFTPGSEITVVIGVDAIILSDAQADSAGEISGAFEVPEKDDVPGADGGGVPVYAIEAATGRESTRVTFWYTSARVSATRDTVRLWFKLNAGGEVPEGTTYWAVYGASGEELNVRRLTDPEGDGAYSFRAELPTGATLAARIVEGTGTRDTSSGALPGEPVRIIEDFGELKLRTDLTLDASAPAGEQGGAGRGEEAAGTAGAASDTGGGVAEPAQDDAAPAEATDPDATPVGSGGEDVAADEPRDTPEDESPAATPSGDAPVGELQIPTRLPATGAGGTCLLRW